MTFRSEFSSSSSSSSRNKAKDDTNTFSSRSEDVRKWNINIRFVDDRYFIHDEMIVNPGNDDI